MMDEGEHYYLRYAGHGDVCAELYQVVTRKGEHVMGASASYEVSLARLRELERLVADLGSQESPA